MFNCFGYDGVVYKARYERNVTNLKDIIEATGSVRNAVSSMTNKWPSLLALPSVHNAQNNCAKKLIGNSQAPLELGIYTAGSPRAQWRAHKLEDPPT